MKNKFLMLNMIIAYLLILSWSLQVKSQSWIRIQEIDSTDILSVIEHDASFYATSYSQIFKGTNAGATWQPTDGRPSATSNFQALFSYGGYVYVGTQDDGIFRSADGGQSWQSFNTGLPGGGGSIIGLTALGDSLYAGTGSNGIYVRNLQTTSSWLTYNTGLFQLGSNSIATSGNNIIASVGFYLFARARTASQWTDVYVDSAGVQRYIFETLAVGQHLYASTDNGVYRGSLDAQNWQRVDIAAFPNRDIVALTAHGSRLIACLSYFGQHWIFSTDDFGATWDFRAHEFAEAWDLFVSGNRLWAGRSDGLWYTDMLSTGIEEPGSIVPDVFRLNQNYPNPFNPSTTISYQIPKAGDVSLRVYDIQGRLVQTLVHEYKNPGKFEVTFDGSQLASGVYLYRLQANDQIISKKMLLTK